MATVDKKVVDAIGQRSKGSPPLAPVLVTEISAIRIRERPHLYGIALIAAENPFEPDEQIAGGSTRVLY